MSGTLTATFCPAAVANDTAPLVPPGAVGANVTGACSASPLCRVTGKLAGTGAPPGEVSVTWPMVNGPGAVMAEELTPVTVTARVAVTVAVRLVAEPTAVEPNSAVPAR